MYEQFAKYLTTDPQTRARKLAALMFGIEIDKVLSDINYIPQEVLDGERVLQSEDVNINVYNKGWTQHNIYVYADKKPTRTVAVTAAGHIKWYFGTVSGTISDVQRGCDFQDYTEYLAKCIARYETAHIEERLATMSNEDVQKAILVELMHIKHQLWHANHQAINDKDHNTYNAIE